MLLNQYIKDLFSEPFAADALASLRSRIQYFSCRLGTRTITVSELKTVIHSFIQASLLSL